MNRIAFTIATAIALTGVFRAYAHFVDPLVEVVQQPFVPSYDEAPPPSSAYGKVAEQYLADDEWTSQARYSCKQSDQVYLYFERWERIDDAAQDKASFSPFALVVRDPDEPNRRPYVLRCDEAVIQFESRLDVTPISNRSAPSTEDDAHESPQGVEGLPIGQPGRIIGGAMRGAVTVTGPEGLYLAGRNFYFAEAREGGSPIDQDGYLYSDEPVRFAFGPAPDSSARMSGSADKVQLALLRSAEGALGQDMPRVAGIRNLRLRSNVRMDFLMDQPDEEQLVTITSDGSFEYEFEERTAKFEQRVHLRQRTSPDGEPEKFDALWCELLELAFERDPTRLTDPIATSPIGMADEEGQIVGLESDLVFRRLKASGSFEGQSRVAFQSDRHGLTVNAHDLQYDMRTRKMALLDDENVVIQYGPNELLCPKITLSLDETGKTLSAAECTGAGRIQRLNKQTGHFDFQAMWKDQLQMFPDPESTLQVIHLRGDARLIQPQGQSGMVSDKLWLWIDPPDQSAMSAAGDGERAPNDRATDTPLQSSKLPLRRVMATGDVALVNPRFEIAHTPELVVIFDEGPVMGSQAESNTLLTGASTNDADDAEQRPAATGVVSLTADFVHVEVVHDPRTGRSDVRRFWTEGDVHVAGITGEQEETESGDETPDDQPHGPFDIRATRIDVTNDGGPRQTMHIYGTPSTIDHPQFFVQGDHLALTRADSTVEVLSPGLMRVPVRNGMNGEVLDEPQPLTVKWQGRMTFDGRTAHFIDSVTASLNDGRMTCGHLDVSLSEGIDFTEIDRRPDDLQIDEIACRDNVLFESREWDDDAVVGIRKAGCVDLTINQQSGQIVASGPGWIQDWRKGRDRRASLANVGMAQANGVAEPDELQWEYTHVRFAGPLTGNYRSRILSMQERVRVMYGPVAHARAIIVHDDLSLETETARKSAWMGCDTLTVRLTEPSEEHEQGAIELTARGNTDLEGKQFRARADLITFDQSKNLFTLKGEDPNQATIWYQRTPGVAPSQTTARAIQFVPTGGRRLVLDEATGIWASQ